MGHTEPHVKQTSIYHIGVDTWEKVRSLFTFKRHAWTCSIILTPAIQSLDCGRITWRKPTQANSIDGPSWPAGWARNVSVLQQPLPWFYFNVVISICSLDVNWLSTNPAQTHQHSSSWIPGGRSSLQHLHMQNCHSMLCNWETPYENQAKISIQNFLFFYSTKILKLKLT